MPYVLHLHLPSSSDSQSLFFLRELYPVLMRALQAVPTELSSHSPQPLSMQRMASMFTLLTQLTLAASSTYHEPIR